MERSWSSQFSSAIRAGTPRHRTDAPTATALEALPLLASLIHSYRAATPRPIQMANM